MGIPCGGFMSVLIEPQTLNKQSLLRVWELWPKLVKWQVY